MSKKRTIKENPLLDLLPDDLRERVINGELIMQEGQSPLKPVLRDAKTGRVVKGSGRPVNANNLGVISRKTAYKRTKAFNEWFDDFIPAVKDDNPDAIISLEELIETAAKVAQGWKKLFEITCPACEHEFKHEMEYRPDAKLLSFLIERRVGKAKETQDINIRSESIVQMLHDQTPIGNIEVVDVTPMERSDRLKQIRESNEPS